jgi:hypothetical protein
LWQEIKNSSENPQRLCTYGPYISYIIKKVTQRAYPNDTKHRPLLPKPSKTVRVPSPQDQQEEQEIYKEREAPRSWDHPWQEEKKHTSPLRKLISIFLGMCKTQRDIEVSQQDERKKNKKMRDTMKALHNQAGCQPPVSHLTIPSRG